MVSRPPRVTPPQTATGHTVISGCAIAASERATTRGETDLTAVRDFVREMKIACDELHDDPFNTGARDRVVRMILQDSRSADTALARLGDRCVTAATETADNPRRP
jgi:hypothetical protein